MCSSCGGSVSTNRVINTPIIHKVTPTNCLLTKTLLTNWLNILTCVKNSGKLKVINLTEVTANQILGFLISALNYPDNYCYYQENLEGFKNNILPRIVENVSECIH